MNIESDSAFLKLFDINFLKETFDKIDHLNNIESPNDPEDEPYRSKYAARSLLEELKKVISNFQDDIGIPTPRPNVDDYNNTNNDSNGERNDATASAPCWVQLTVPQRIHLISLYVEGKLGVNYIDCEETSTGEEHLLKVTKSVEEFYGPHDPASVYLLVYFSNQLGILYASRRQLDKASNILHKSEGLYKTYHQLKSVGPLSPNDYLASSEGSYKFNSETERWSNFEAEYTQTLYYLAQVYQKLGKDGDAIEYIKTTLKRQLELKQTYTPISWALNAATLSQYYLTQNDFSLSRHCLASAMKILEEEGEIEKSSEDDSKYVHVISIRRCWIKYGISLIEESWTRLMQEPDDSSVNEERESKGIFDLELTTYENWMTDKWVLDFDQARSIFLKVKELIQEAQSVFTIDEYCSDYIEIVQDHSRLFKALIIFEPAPDRRSKMHKRRADMLEDLIKQLNRQYYLLVWRQLVYELAETYADMVDCKRIIQEENSEQITPQSISKMNSICQKSIDNFSLYVSSLKPPGSDELPDPLPPGDERPTLLAWINIARLYYKMFYRYPEERLQTYHNSLRFYKKVVEFCDKRPEYAKAIERELPACREFATLLPAKIAQVTRGLPDP